VSKPDSDRIDPQLLAALIEGRLSEPRRSELLARLAKSPDDLALIADVATVSAEGQPSITPIADRGSRKRWRPGNLGWLAIAAAVVGVTTISVLQREATQERGLPPDLAFAFPSWRGSTRGDAVPIDSVALSWRVGTRLADLDAAIAARDSARVAEFAREIETLLSAASAGLASTVFGSIADSAGADSEQLERLAKLGRDGLTRRVDPRITSLATWMEETRIAAYGDTASVRRRAEENASRLRWLGESHPETAARIRGAIARGDWDSIKLTLGAMLDSLGRS
jgi:hypothetical protein